MTSVGHSRESNVMVKHSEKEVSYFCNLFYAKLQSRHLFKFIPYFRLFKTYGKAMDQPRFIRNPNPEFI